jgi:hypothetical protein
MSKKIIQTAMLCLVMLTVKAQTVPIVGIGCTIPFCSTCLASYSGTGSFSSSNTSVATVASSGSITGLSIGSAIISYTFTAPGCGSGIFTSTVDVVHPAAFNGVSETAPFSLGGDEAYTYSAASGLTLNVNSYPAILPGATYTWDDGISSPYTTSSSSYSPTYTLGSVSVTHDYTVTVTYAGCTSVVNTIVVVPASGCDPYTAFNVNALRTTDPYTTLSGISPGVCPDCGTTQVFHTIVTSSLTVSNISDLNNYYIVNPVTFAKATYNGDIFYMNAGTYINVNPSVVSNVTMAGCHLFSQCSWFGINVPLNTSATTGYLNMVQSMIEDVTTAGPYSAAINVNPAQATGSYYSPGMLPVLNSIGNIFNNNERGIQIQDYQPAYASGITYPFNIVNTIFTNRDFVSGPTSGSASPSGYYPFSWPANASLQITAPSPTDPVFGLDAYTKTGLNQTGIELDNIGSSAIAVAGSGMTPDVYAYNDAVIGINSPDPSFGMTNIFDNYSFGVQLVSSNAQFYNNTFRETHLSGLWYANYSSQINDLNVLGNNSDNSNNRFYNCAGEAIYIGAGSPRDFKCINGQFTGVYGTAGIAMYLNPDGNSTRGNYSINNNFIYNYYSGIVLMYSGSPTYSILNGSTKINNNIIRGKTGASYPEGTIYGIWFDDYNRVYGPGGSNGIVNIMSNSITGVEMGIDVYSLNQNTYVNNNQISVASYSGTGLGWISGIFLNSVQYLQTVQNNTIGGFGYSCSPTAQGIVCDAVGLATNSADISCNSVHDVNSGFLFMNTNYLQWHENQMVRNQIGMDMESNAVIGTQGTSTNPMDNHWDVGVGCSICVPSTCSDWPSTEWNTPGIHQTYIGTGVSASSSVLNVRGTSGIYAPVYNGAAGTSTAYSYGLGTIVDVSGTATSAPPTCASGTFFREGHFSTGTGGLKSTIVSAEAYTLYPNPSDGNLTITQEGSVSKAVNVEVFNTLGQRVYQGLLNFDGGKANIKIDNAVPGMYQVKLSDEKGEIWNKKVVIEKQ